MHAPRKSPVLCGPLFFLLALGIGAQTDLLAGVWKVNLAKSHYEPGPAPKSATIITYRRTPEGYEWFTGRPTAQGAPAGSSGTIVFDGKFRPVAGNRNYDELAFTPRDALTTLVTRRRAGKVVQTGLRVLSSDGATLTITFDGTDADGRTIHETVVYEKQQRPEASP